MLSTMETAAPSTMEEQLLEELKYAPTHILTENGIEPITRKPKVPSPIQVALMEEPAWLMTGLEWSNLQLEAQIAALIDVGQDIDSLTSDIVDLFSEHTKKWLTGWQQQINSGSCWNTSGSIGRQADNLIQQGFCLLAPTPTRGPYNNMPSRDIIRAGTPGSPAFVRTVMGQRYLDWISTI